MSDLNIFLIKGLEILDIDHDVQHATLPLIENKGLHTDNDG